MTNINGINPHNLYGIKENLQDSRNVSMSQMDYSLFYDENKGVNEQIDEGVFQGNSGDCWLISGIMSLSYTDEGKELIKDSISQNDNGNYVVNFKGLGKSYEVSQDELDEYNISTYDNAKGKESTYTTGDDDMLLMELACKKAIDDPNTNIPTNDGVNGGSAYYLYQMLSDNPTAYAYGDNFEQMANFMTYYYNNQDNTSATLGIVDSFSGLPGDHAYAVKDYDGYTMTIVNPWNTTEDIKVTNDELIDNFGSYDMSLADMTPEETTADETTDEVADKTTDDIAEEQTV